MGFEVEVLDDAGKVRAITGKRYNFDVGPVYDPDSLARLESLGAVAESACGPKEVN